LNAYASFKRSDNQRGILYLLAAYACFIFNDTCVKLASDELSIPHIIVLRSLIALPVVLLICWHQGALSNLLALRDRFLWLRTVGEIGGTATFLTALAHLEIASISAIAQITPLAVTAGAALCLGERVRADRWVAIGVGFVAVLLIIRPGTEGFNVWSLLALCAVGFVVLRDLSSRAMALSVHPLTVTVLSLATLIPLGLLMSPFEPWSAVSLRALLLCVAAAGTLSMAYVLVVQAMRYGEVSVVAPFRYSVLLWAILIQIVVFSVWPDPFTLLGSAILVGTGLYAVLRERAAATPALVPSPGCIRPPHRAA
jgi:drug/metabolite transporter (DMT)-like permease